MTTPHRRIELQACPHCGYIVDSISPSEGFEMPISGDIVLCMKCAFVMQLDNTLHLVAADLSKLTTDEIEDVVKLTRTIRSGSSYFAENN